MSYERPAKAGFFVSAPCNHCVTRFAKIRASLAIERGTGDRLREVPVENGVISVDARQDSLVCWLTHKAGSFVLGAYPCLELPQPAPCTGVRRFGRAGIVKALALATSEPFRTKVKYRYPFAANRANEPRL